MASRARAEGNCNYRLWTTEELIDAYAWEAKRINQEDRKRTQQLIKQELKRRFDATLRLLDDEQTTENPKGTYRYLQVPAERIRQQPGRRPMAGSFARSRKHSFANDLCAYYIADITCYFLRVE